MAARMTAEELRDEEIVGETLKEGQASMVDELMFEGVDNKKSQKKTWKQIMTFFKNEGKITQQIKRMKN